VHHLFSNIYFKSKISARAKTVPQIVDMAETASRSSLEKPAQMHVEEAAEANTSLQRYPLLREKSDDEFKRLDKAVLKKLDWKFLPCITAMLVMK